MGGICNLLTSSEGVHDGSRMRAGRADTIWRLSGLFGFANFGVAFSEF